MLRSTEKVHYRKISLLEKCRCKDNAEKTWLQCKVAAWEPSPWALPAPSLLAQPLHTFLDLSKGYLLSASPPASGDPTQSKAATPVIIIITHWKQELWVTFYLYPEFITLKTSFSPLIKVSLDEHQYCCDTGPSQPVSPKLLGYLGERKGWLQLSFA